MEGYGQNPLMHEEVELNLGLSTNGRFGMDPTIGEMLGRSSSVANPVFAVVGGGGSAAEFESHAPSPVRAQSLPIETVEEALSRRMELESMRRIEARRERKRKLRASREKKNAAVGLSSSADPIEVLKPNQTEDVWHLGSYRPKDSMSDMPLVTTMDPGSHGSKVQGLLYVHKKDEEVKILCVCHGVFFTPKEFVVHGGCGDVENPLEHIIVSPFPLT